MLTQTGKRAKSVSLKVIDEFRFFRSWVGSPLKTGAISPSGPALARMMARMAEPQRDGPIIELGPGTGVVTQALVERGIPLKRLVLIEYNADFCKLLRTRFPGITVIEGDAYALGETLPDLAVGSVASVVSSLPLVARPAPARKELILEGLEYLAPRAPFVQFSYSLFPPVEAVAGVVEVDKTNWVINNLPPARVWTYRSATN